MVEAGILKRLEDVEQKHREIEKTLADPDITPTEIHQYSKEHSELDEIVTAYRKYKEILEEIAENKTLLEDPEIGELAQQEIETLETKKEKLEEKLRLLLLPKDPKDTKDSFLEIRAGTGGDEAALFAADLYRMYTRYAERKGWKVEIMNLSETGMGGIKEIVASIEGKNVYGELKHESGVHRVQRIPETETGGRIHTSTATVAVLPEPEDIEVTINEGELKIDTYRASGPGGQHVNKTDSAVRITHEPTGIVVQCQDERSQHKNRTKAMRMLRAKLFEIEEERRASEISITRRDLVGSGERSEKIRTYNFPQNRITDHRLGLTLHNIDAVLDGEIDELIESLKSHHEAERIKELEENPDS